MSTAVLRFCPITGRTTEFDTGAALGTPGDGRRVTWVLLGLAAEESRRYRVAT